MSKYLHELCCRIIEDFYGEFYSNIFYQLGHNGRYTAVQIAQKTRLPLRQVKAGLAILVQLRLVYHHSESVVSSYQANTNTSYEILRFGKLSSLVHGKYGNLATEIIAQIALLGFATVAEIDYHISQSQNSSHANHANGNTNNMTPSQPDTQQIESTIRALLRDGFLIPLRSAHFQTHHDAFRDAEARLRNLGMVGVVKGRKSQAEHEERVEMSIQDRQSTEGTESGFVPSTGVGQKRAFEDEADSMKKRQKLSNGSAYSQHTLGGNERPSKSENSTLLCLNYQNVVLSIRNNYLGDIASKHLGSRHSQVLLAALDQVPPATLYSTPTSEHWLNLNKIRQTFDETSLNNNSKRQHRSNGVHPDSDEEDQEDGPTSISQGELDRSLASLSEGMFGFLQGGYSKDQWKINRDELNTCIKEQELLSMIRNRLGPGSLRIVRMLIDKGRLDEKTLQETGLLGAKDLRQTLAELNQMGFIDLQEVPRDAQRQTSRTIFLWFHDQDRVHKVVLEALYKAMTRLLQRLRKERKELASTLEKVERSDVRGSEEQMLSAAELKVWRRWQRREEWMLAELNRLDDSVAILRDL